MEQTPPLNALKTFEAAARNDGFARAADELCVTQSAVSHQIRQLEDWFGVRLFDRTGGRARLTPQGQRLARALGEAFADIRTACRSVSESAAGEPLNIAVIPSVATCWLIPRMAGFNRKHPDITIRFMYAIHGHPIDFRQADVAIVYSQGRPAVPSTRVTEVFEGAAVPVCSQLFLERRGPLSGPEQIATAPLLHDTDWQGWSDWFMNATGEERLVSEGPVFEDFNLMRSAALSGQGVALCPLSVITDDLEAGRLLALSDITVNEDHAYYVLEPVTPRKGAAAETEAFKTWLLEAAGAS